MNFHTVLDISAVIWDEIDYEDYRHDYSVLATNILILIDKLETSKPKILMRPELLNEILDNNFPYGKGYELGLRHFEYRTTAFLRNIGADIITYDDIINPYLTSIPDLIKSHYNITIQNEIKFLIHAMHIGAETKNIYFTFQFLWEGGEDKLKTLIGEDIKEYETIICDKRIKSDEKLTELDNFFAKFKRIFEHNPKHDKGPKKTREAWEKWLRRPGRKKTPFISQLSCYNGEDDIRPQELLDSAFKLGKKYYNYDEYNEVWVTFQSENPRILRGPYHGYDEYDENQIPNDVRKHFNK